MTRRIAFVGPLPPPVHGFSNICQLMFQLFRERTTVVMFDRAPARNLLSTVTRQLLGVLRYAPVCMRRRDTILYMALSGGRGQLIDMIYVLLARMLRQKIFIHHHSFSYINFSSLLNRCFFSLIGDASHIVLTPGMGEALQARYRLDSAHVRVISNAAFFAQAIEKQHPASGALDPSPASQGIRIGYLSNITVEKGFVEFFRIVESLAQQGTQFKAKIAGPLSEDARGQFESLLAANPCAEYLGPLYGDAKDAFYRELDVFVFPTKYPNEAEPLVLYEAMTAAVYVIASDRGGIRDMLGDKGLAVPEASIVVIAAERINRLAENHAELATVKDESRKHAREVSRIAASNLNTFLDEIVAAT